MSEVTLDVVLRINTLRSRQVPRRHGLRKLRKVFACPVETRYRVGSRQGDRYFCSWNCFRTVDKPKEERRRRAFERDTVKYDEEMRRMAMKRHRYYLNKKLKTSREKVEYYYALRSGCKKGTPEYEYAQKMLTQWRKRRSDVLKELEEAK